MIDSNYTSLLHTRNIIKDHITEAIGYMTSACWKQWEIKNINTVKTAYFINKILVTNGYLPHAYLGSNTAALWELPHH
jgi:hypothetical protein